MILSPDNFYYGYITKFMVFDGENVWEKFAAWVTSYERRKHIIKMEFRQRDDTLAVEIIEWTMMD